MKNMFQNPWAIGGVHNPGWMEVFHSSVMSSPIIDEEKHNIIEYTRTTQTTKSTIGEFIIPGTNISGYFIEPAGPDTLISNKDQRIPKGSYNMIKNVGAKYGLRLYNGKVPESRAILIHIGNYPKDTEGCLLPGKTKGVDFVGSSGPLINEMKSHFSQYNYQGKIIISENYE